MHSVNVSYCFYYYPSLITVPSPNNSPFPCTSVFSSPPRKFSLFLLINQKPLCSSRLNSTTDLSPGIFPDHPNPQQSLPFPHFFHLVLGIKCQFSSLSKLKKHKALGLGPIWHTGVIILCFFFAELGTVKFS